MIRERLIFSVSVWAIALASWAAAITHLELRSATRGYEDATRTVDLPYRVPILGWNGDWLSLDADRLQEQLNAIREANIRWIRQEIAWGAAATGDASRNGEELDRFLSALRDFPEIQLIAWFTSPPTGIAAEQIPAAMAEYVAEFATRYGETVDHYQIGTAIEDVEWYATILAAVTSTLQERDPVARIITAPMRAPLAVDQLAEIYALEANQFWDIVAVSTDPLISAPSNRRVDPQLNPLSQLFLVREKLRQQQEGHKPIWLVDLRWHDSLPQEKFTLLQQLFHRALREWPWLGVIFLPLQEGESWVQSSEFQEWRSSAPQDGRYAMDHEAIQYSGQWTFQNGAADYSRDILSELTFPFTGREVALLLREDAWHTVLYLSVDGEAADALPSIQRGRSYLILTSADRQPQKTLTTVARQLSLAEHVLQLTGGGGDTHYALLGISVSSGNLAEPYERQIAFATVGLFLATVFAGSTALPFAIPIAKRFTRQRVAWRERLALATGPEPISTRSLGFSALLAGASYLLLQAQLHPYASLAATAVLWLLFVRNRVLGLSFVLFALPLARLPIHWADLHFPPAEYLLLITLAAELTVRTFHWRQSILKLVTTRWQALDLLTLLWLSLGAVTLLWARWPEPALTDWRTLFLEPAIFYGLLRLHAGESNRQGLLVIGLLSGAALVAAIGIFQLLNGTVFATAESGVRRLVSVYGSPNHAALFFGRCLPYAVTLWWFAKDSRARRFAAAGITLILLSAILLTQSFAALLLGLPVMILAVSWATRLRWIRRVCLALLILFILTVLLGGRWNDWLNWQEGSLFVRWNVWWSALEMWHDHPLRGLGLDQFLYAYRDTYIAPDAWQDPDISHPHNVLLDVWLRLGILGVGLFFATQWQFWRAHWPIIRRKRTVSHWSRWLCFASATSMVYLFAHGWVDNSIFVLDLAHLFAFQMATAAALRNETTTHPGVC